MASYVFDSAKKLLGSGKLNFNGGGPYRLALMTDAMANEAVLSLQKIWSDIKQYEINYTGNTPVPLGYSSKELAGVNITEATNTVDYSIVYANDVEYLVSTISASYIVIVKGANASGDSMMDDDQLIEAIDIRVGGIPVMSNNGVFSIKLRLGSNGFLMIK